MRVLPDFFLFFSLTTSAAPNFWNTSSWLEASTLRHNRLPTLACQYSHATWAGEGASSCRESRQSVSPHKHLVPLLTDPPLASQQWGFREGRNKTVSCVFCQDVGYSREDSCLAMWSSSGLKFLREVATARPPPNCTLRPNVQRCRHKQPSPPTCPGPHTRSCGKQSSTGRTADEESSRLRNVLVASPRTPFRGCRAM